MERPKHIGKAVILALTAGFFLAHGEKTAEIEKAGNKVQAAVKVVIPTAQEVAIHSAVKSIILNNDPEFIEKLKADIEMAQKALEGDSRSIEELCGLWDELYDEDNKPDPVTYREAYLMILGVEKEDLYTMQRGDGIKKLMVVLNTDELLIRSEEHAKSGYVPVGVDPVEYYEKYAMETLGTILRLQADEYKDQFNPLFLGGAGITTEEELKDTVRMIADYFTQNPRLGDDVYLPNLKKSYGINQ